MTTKELIQKALVETQPYVTFFIVIVFWNVLNKMIGKMILVLDITLYSSGVFMHHPEIGKLHDSMANFGYFVIFYFTVIRHYYRKVSN